MESVGIPVLLAAAQALFKELNLIRILKKENDTVVSDIDEFRQSLEACLQLVKTRGNTLHDDPSWAIESLAKDLQEARTFLESCRTEGGIQGYWDAKRIRRELTALRDKLSHNFLAKLFFASFEVILDKEKRTNDFHAKLLEQLTRSATHSDIDSSTSEIKSLLKPLTTDLKVHEVRLGQLRADIRALSAPLESTLETEKFLEDILASLAEPIASEDEKQYYDPFTCELMCDPVKGDDGKTYDRFSLFKYNTRTRNKPIIILVPDENVRIRLYEKFPHEHLDKIMRSRRDEYRKKALALAGANDFGEALLRLENVLQWDPEDSDCLHQRDKMRDLYREKALYLAEAGDYEEALDMLQTVQRWSPSDRDVFDNLEMVKRQISTKKKCSQALLVLKPPVPMDPMDAGNPSKAGTRNEEEEEIGIIACQPNESGSREDCPELLVRIPGNVNSRDAYPYWTESQACFGYVACILCGCKPCFFPQMFGENVKEYELLGPFFGLFPLVCGAFCLDYAISSCRHGKLIGPKTMHKLCLDSCARKNCVHR